MDIPKQSLINILVVQKASLYVKVRRYYFLVKIVLSLILGTQLFEFPEFHDVHYINLISTS